MTAAVACAVLVATLSGSEPSAAAAVLEQAASRLDAAPRPALPAGSSWYIQTRERVLDMTSYTKKPRPGTLRRSVSGRAARSAE